MANPLDIHFNVAVMAIANSLFPTGWDVTMDKDEAPSDLESLNHHINTTGRMLVYGGDSDTTIFADREHNYAFRAWHDWCHWRLQARMTDNGEYATYLMMCAHISQKFKGDSHNRSLWHSILYIEIVEMNAFYNRNGFFPADQRAFTERMLHELRHVVMDPTAVLHGQLTH